MDITLKGQGKPPKPPPLPGFGHVRRYWNPQSNRWTAKILPGEFFVTGNDEVITTILGSCISVCMRDPVLRVGGMNHFMLPEDMSAGTSSWMEGAGGLATRFGSYAMESLINELLKLGAERGRIEVKLFGGGRILSSMTDIGARNIAFARGFLKLEGFRVTAEDLGATCPRHVDYYPVSGRVMLKRLRALSVQAIANDELKYREGLVEQPSQADVELFS